MSTNKVECKNCRYFRAAPYEARVDGCYFPDNMPSKQSASYLDEQQVAGNPAKINLRGDCKDFEPKPARAPFLQWLLRA